MAVISPAAAPLPSITTEVLTSLYQHRLLTTAQVHAMHLPGRTRRRAEQTLATLTQRGLAAFVKPARTSPRLYYLTLAGAQAVETIPTRVETRRKLVTPEQAAGPLWQHTLAVNDTGIAFMHAARELGDEFGALSWRHEIAHQAPTPGHTRGELLISDALLTYLEHQHDGQITFHYRLLELDRATVPTDTLATKLARYANLYHHTQTMRGQPSGKPAWQDRYPVFPDVACVLTGQSRSALQRRAQTVLALCHEDRRLQSAPEVRVSLTLLEDLQDRGPFAPIWHRPQNPARAVNWLGVDAAKAAVSVGV
jgi:Replication-relaxation